MRKLIVLCAVATAAVGVGGTAGAATPTVRGCVGESVSAAAEAFQPYGRNFISTVAPRNDFGSLGDAVQAFQAGEVPDEVYPNTCND